MRCPCGIVMLSKWMPLWQPGALWAADYCRVSPNNVQTSSCRSIHYQAYMTLQLHASIIRIEGLGPVKIPLKSCSGTISENYKLNVMKTLHVDRWCVLDSNKELLIKVTAGWCCCRTWESFLSCVCSCQPFFPHSCLCCFSRWGNSWGDVWQDVYCDQPGKIFCHQRGWWSSGGLHHWPPSCKGPLGSKTLGSAV